MEKMKEMLNRYTCIHTHIFNHTHIDDAVGLGLEGLHYLAFGKGEIYI